ncbi:MAG: hypothetical protein JWO65_1545 [Sphingomonas bacterium]|nr:hypothetical protein [Sphingomonas bacterium]
MARKRGIFPDKQALPDGQARADEQAGAEERAARRPDAIMQRVRVGVTGLAAVFLLTLLAASIFNMLGQDDRGTTRLANGQTVASNSAAAVAEETPREPLAELGVAPGNAPKAPVAAPRPTPAAPAPSARPMASQSAPVPVAAARP